MSPRNRRQKISSITYSDIEQRENTSFEKPQIESMLKCGISKNAARERTRVKSLRNAFHTLQESLPSVPPNTKLSKLDVLVLATTYISHLRRILGQDLDDVPQEINSCPIMTENPSDPLSAYSFDLMDHRPKRKTNYLHPVRKWPMRSRLYAGIEDSMSSTALNMPSNYYQQWT